MSHECHSTTLRGGTKEGDLDISLLEVGCVMVHGSPGGWADGLLIVVKIYHIDVERRIDFDKAPNANLQ
jgi:hypothetical protein